jgi:hypothetical protein
MHDVTALWSLLTRTRPHSGVVGRVKAKAAGPRAGARDAIRKRRTAGRSPPPAEVTAAAAVVRRRTRFDEMRQENSSGFHGRLTDVERLTTMWCLKKELR